MATPQQAGGRVLVTGGAGFIGTTLARELADCAEQWVVLDHLHPQVHGIAALQEWIATRHD
jgi:dTDP-L-rhamnose 4-epimerase